MTLLGTNISHSKGTFEDNFPIPKVGYVSSLGGTHVCMETRSLFFNQLWWRKCSPIFGRFFLRNLPTYRSLGIPHKTSGALYVSWFETVVEMVVHVIDVFFVSFRCFFSSSVFWGGGLAIRSGHGELVCFCMICVLLMVPFFCWFGCMMRYADIHTECGISSLYSW